MSDSLEKVIPSAITVRCRSGDIEVHPIKFGRLPQVLKACAPILPAMREGRYADALMQNADAFLDTLVSATGLPRDRVEALELDEALDLAIAVVEANSDFFIQAVAPRIEAAADRFVNAIGSTSLNDSSAQGTA